MRNKTKRHLPLGMDFPKSPNGSGVDIYVDRRGDGGCVWLCLPLAVACVALASLPGRGSSSHVTRRLACTLSRQNFLPLFISGGSLCVPLELPMESLPRWGSHRTRLVSLEEAGLHSRPDNISSLSPPLTFSEQISSIDTIFPAFGFQFFHVVFMQQHIRINSLTNGSCFSLILVSFCSAPLPLSLSLRSCSSFTWTCLVVACAVPATRHHLLLRHNCHHQI